MKSIPNHLAFLGAAVVALTITACDGPLGSDAAVTGPLLQQAAAPSLMPCATAGDEAAAGLVTTLGGVIAAGANAVRLPPLAVLSLTLIELRQVPSPYMMVELTANNSEHWLFRRSLEITLDYSHCPVESVERGPLTVWLVDPATGEMLQNMGGVDDPASRTITFETDHFSGYAIAN